MTDVIQKENQPKKEVSTTKPHKNWKYAINYIL